jgi:hypothetical protein
MRASQSQKQICARNAHISHRFSPIQQELALYNRFGPRGRAGVSGRFFKVLRGIWLRLSCLHMKNGLKNNRNII